MSLSGVAHNRKLLIHTVIHRGRIDICIGIQRTTTSVVVSCQQFPHYNNNKHNYIVVVVVTWVNVDNCMVVIRNVLNNKTDMTLTALWISMWKTFYLCE